MSGGHDAHEHDHHAPKASSGGGGGHSVIKGVTNTIANMFSIGIELFAQNDKHH